MKNIVVTGERGYADLIGLGLGWGGGGGEVMMVRRLRTFSLIFICCMCVLFLSFFLSFFLSL